MLIYSTTVSVDGYITDRNGGIDWSSPSDELFQVHLDRVRGLGAHLAGRRLYEAMLLWETDPSLSATPLGAQFAAAWTALPKVVFSRTLDAVQGSSRLATAPLADEIAAALGSDDRDVEIGGADLAGQALELGLVDELRIFRAPVILGGGTRHLPAVPEHVRLELVETATFSGGMLYERYRRLR